MIQAIIFILLIIFGVGFPLTLWISPRHNIAGRFGLSYLLGIGIFTLVMYITNLLGLKLTIVNNFLIFLALSLPLIFFERKRLKDFWKVLRKSVKNFHPDSTEKITLGVIIFFVVSSFVSTLYWPVYIWDALTLYDFRAHVFVQTGFIKSALSALGGGYYFGYPLLTSLSHSIVYLSGGNNPQFIYSLFYLSLGLVFYGLLRESVSRKLSLLFTLTLLIIPQIFNQSVVSYTNLPCLTFFSLGAIYFYVWDKKRTPGYLILTSILIGLSTWTRSTEPFWLAVFGLVIIVSIYRKRLLDILTFSVFFFPIQQVWKNFQTSTLSLVPTLNEVTGAASVLINVFNFKRWQEVIAFLYHKVVLTWGPVFILFLVVFVYSLATRKVKSIFLIYLITFSLLVMLFAGTFIFSFTFPLWSQIPDSASRTAMIFYPMFVFSTALVVSKINKK